MGQSLSEKRWAENEVVFRQRNKAALDDLQDMRTVAHDEGQEVTMEDNDDDVLLFYCECANEDCHERISLSTRDYKRHHTNASQFILKPGHHVPEIERIIRDEGTFIVVEKYMTPPKDVTGLNPTPL